MQIQQKNDLEGSFRLLYCSGKGDIDGLIQELENGAEPNLTDFDKRTALHLAACENCTEIVVLLLEKGADVNCSDRWGRTPLSDARSSGHKEICKILEEHGAIDPVGVSMDTHSPCYEIDHNEVNMRDSVLIGQGEYDEVYLVKWRGTEVAAKTIRSSIAASPLVKKSFQKQLELWQKLRHPNIVQFLGVLKDSDRLTFLIEHHRRGSLYDILRKKGRLDPLIAVSYSLDIARQFSYQKDARTTAQGSGCLTVASCHLKRIRVEDKKNDSEGGMNYLHQRKPQSIIHRDLTPRSVLQDDGGRLRVTDFGFSQFAEDIESSDFGPTGGAESYRYMAPEVYRREPYGKSADVFSFAVVVHEMFQGRHSNRKEPAEKIADKQAYQDSRPQFSSFIYPDSIKMLVNECWHKKPALRPTFEEIIYKLEVIQEELKSNTEACCVNLW